eukprot:TRINITY_DN2879_c0_g1_i1.p3 TRINITY_DN2879_c0_g1~~TRINITY_DN2879_c0_g1_i1.p3  ORF type:complete len:252 (+),score=59.80 TRINITY_DN2879_c0_g1_i1:2-757(+)
MMFPGGGTSRGASAARGLCTPTPTPPPCPPHQQKAGRGGGLALRPFSLSCSRRGIVVRAMARLMPKLVVFDLDACLWDPEVYQLHAPPCTPVRGDLGGAGEGVVGAATACGRQTVKLHPGALLALQELRGRGDVKVAAASTSLNPAYSYQCLDLLEVVPGVSVRSCFHYHQIGREGRLTSRKTGHFELLQKESGIAYRDMLFFDDCGWDDHVGDIRQTFGVLGRATPDGLQVRDWRAALEMFHSERSKAKV